MTQQATADGEAAVWERDFTLYFIGVVCSLTGVWVRLVAQSWLVYRLTGSAWLLGLVGFVTTLPIFLFSPVAGVAVDRFPRQRVLAFTQGGMALVMVALALLDGGGVIEVWHVLALAFVGGAISAFDWPTRLSLVPNLVAPAALPRAVALNSAAWNGARVLGPVVAGLLLPLVGTAGSFWAAAALYAPVLLALPFVRVRRATARGHGAGFLGNLASGYRYVLGHPVLLTLLLLELVPIVFGQTFPLLMPVFAADVLGANEQALGWLMASLGAGELIGTLIVALTSAVPRRPVWVLAGVVSFGLMMVAFAASRSLPLSLALLALAGLAGAGYSTLNGTLIQSVVSDEYRGRVMSVYSMIWGMTPIGSLELGALAQGFGAPAAVGFNGLLLVLFAVLLVLRVPHIRKM